MPDVESTHAQTDMWLSDENSPTGFFPFIFYADSNDKMSGIIFDLNANMWPYLLGWQRGQKKFRCKSG